MDKDDLWVIFKLSESMYAVNSGCIEGIASVPEQVTVVPEAESYVRGIVKQRGRIVTLIDLCRLFCLKKDKSGDAPVDDGSTMMIMIKIKEEQSLALVVDEIVGVEQIGEIYRNSALDKISHSELVGGVASTLDGNNLLLLIDEKQINRVFSESGVQNEMESVSGMI